MRFLLSFLAMCMTCVVAVTIAKADHGHSHHNPTLPSRATSSSSGSTWRRRRHLHIDHTARDTSSLGQTRNTDIGELNDHGVANITSRALVRRFGPARYTFYDAGKGACGKVNSNSDFVSASFFVFGVWACPSCPWAALDLSRGLFNYFANEDVGVINGDWRFI
ncbi:hypothetical protein CVT24_007322 [Panaeolus cyanescens]|uniref:RlpA-like protein double-psi beta-barrel domain-containing protein n=1 Tax=Panaeolus cyanescens TaxID=181874 RepID=A0A409W5E1_9AGAR|nr:hypothetical protein CVT24_007322 [Panaeolus cyanescens]